MKIGLQFSKMCQIRYRIKKLKFIIVTHTFIVRYPFSLLHSASTSSVGCYLDLLIGPRVLGFHKQQIKRQPPS